MIRHVVREKFKRGTFEKIAVVILGSHLSGC